MEVGDILVYWKRESVIIGVRWMIGELREGLSRELEGFKFHYLLIHFILNNYQITYINQALIIYLQ